MIRFRSWFHRAYVLAGFFTLLMYSTSVKSALIVYEGFDYPAATSLRTQTGGTGWSGAWTNTGNATEISTSPGLTYPNLTTQGNKATLNGQQTTSTNGNSAFLLRDTSQTFGTDGTTLWLSFISQRTGNKSAGGTGATLNYQRVFALSLFNSTTEQASVGELSNDNSDTWAINPDATTIVPSVHTTTSIDTQAFLLARLDFVGAGADKMYLWVNPDLSQGEPAIGTEAASITDDLTFNRIRMTVGGSQNSGATLAAQGLFDEIRVGDTFTDVTSVPEPVAMSLLLVGLVCLTMARGIDRGNWGNELIPWLQCSQAGPRSPA